MTPESAPPVLWIKKEPYGSFKLATLCRLLRLFEGKLIVASRVEPVGSSPHSDLCVPSGISNAPRRRGLFRTERLRNGIALFVQVVTGRCCSQPRLPVFLGAPHSAVGSGAPSSSRYSIWFLNRRCSH